MRKRFPISVMEIMDKDERVVVLLGDIGVFAFKDVFDKYPTRCINMGICEQSMIGVAAGMAIAGFIPIVHTIEPFLVDRAFEQIKIDFGHQELKGTIVGVDVEPTSPNLGYTHQCKHALDHMIHVQGMQVFAPQSPEELDSILKDNYAGCLNYIRIK